MKRYGGKLLSGVLLLWGFLFPSVSFSQEVSSPLASLVDEALSRNPRVKAGERQVAAVRQELPQSWALDDPMFEFAVGNMMIDHVETRVGPQEEIYAFSQMVPFPLKLFQKYQIARAQVAVAQQELAMAEREVVRDVKKAYYELCWATASIAVLGEVRDLLQKMQSVAQARYAGGRGGQRDVAKAQVELSMTYERLYQYEQQRQVKLAQLRQLMNRSGDEKIIAAVELLPPQLKPTLPELLALAKTERPDILKLTQEEKRQKEEIKLAKLGYAPDLKVDYRYIGVEGGMTLSAEDGKDAKMVMLGVSVPLWLQKNNGAIGQAHEKWRQTQELLQEEKNRAEYEVRDALAQHTAAMQTVQLYLSSTLPQAKLALSSDQSGYEAGTSDFLDLLDSSRSYLDVKLSYLKMVLDAWMAIAELERVVGRELL